MFQIKKKEFEQARFRRDIVGIKQKVPTLSKKRLQYINFDNAASTPALHPVLHEINDFLGWYSGVHRGTGYKSLLSSQVYDNCHEIVGKFVKADMDNDTVIMVKNTTEAINKLSYRLALTANDIIISTSMEHHSNDLPWRRQNRVEYAGINQQGQLNLLDVEAKLRRNYPKVKLLTVCGASNVTGHLNPIHDLAEMAHEYRAQILVDAAQLIPHQPIDMKPAADLRHIDYLAFSGHKLYAPFGSGVLIGPHSTFLKGAPEYSGGGTVSMVTSKDIYWGSLPDREEAGSPNVIGAFALAQTIKYLEKMDMQKLTQYEDDLTRYTWREIQKLPGVKMYGTFPRVGVITFNLAGIGHSLLGSILCYENGIGVRTGCFCAQPYVRKLLGIDENQEKVSTYLEQNLAQLPGLVRISLAAYNTKSEIDRFTNSLKTIIASKEQYKKTYKFSEAHGHYLPEGLVNNSSFNPFIIKPDCYLGAKISCQIPGDQQYCNCSDQAFQPAIHTAQGRKPD